MARTINHQERTAKRGEILDTAQHLVLIKGYERMAISDILDALKISSGAFYHYFGSKPAVLEALVERIRDESEGPLSRIVEDPRLSAIDKLKAFFGTLDQMRRNRQDAVLAVLRVWHADHNAIVRQKVDAAVRAARVPMLTAIAAQGVREGVFALQHPGYAGDVVSALVEGMGRDHAHAILGFGADADETGFAQTMIAIHAAYIEAIERVLGAPKQALGRIDAADVGVWTAALRPARN